MDLKEILQAFRDNRAILERVLMRTIDTPRWIRIIPLLDRIAEITNQIEIEATKREEQPNRVQNNQTALQGKKVKLIFPFGN